MKFLKLKNVLGAVAPTLGQAMAGPLGKSAGDIVAKVLGCDSTPQAIEQSLQQITPEQLAAIKAAESEFAAKMKELDVDLFKLETKDRQDARKYFAKDLTSKAIALSLVAGFLAYIYLITVADPEDNPMEIINLILGWLGAQVSSIISFYFGSSHTPEQ